jgi:Ca-activated chloride channel family protein
MKRQRFPRRLLRLATLALFLGGLASGLSAAGADDPLLADTCGGGALVVFGDGECATRYFPLEHTEVRARIAGSVNRVEVTQVFGNPYAETVEAVYVFPLPHESAVCDYEMRLGERTIRGVIERRDEARRLYEEAKLAGKVAAVLEQERPNIFTQSVANILPGTRVQITLTYLETLPFTSEGYEFVFPMVVGPRFLPAGPADIQPAGGLPPVDVPKDDLNPPFLPPAVRSGHDIAVSVEIDAGMPLGPLASPTHAIRVERPELEQASVFLEPHDSIPNRDFVLRYGIVGDQPQAAVLTCREAGEGFLTLLLQPQPEVPAAEITPKEMILVVDCSGSMSGEPLAMAKGLIRHALRRLNPRDSFQIIRFSTAASGLAPAPLERSPENVSRALAYVDQLQGSGGTHMLAGIQAALDYPSDPDRLRIVVFLTDGYIGNEAEILAAIRARVRGARLFSFGVGSSVNRYLLAEMAREGRGAAQFVLLGSSVTEEVARFYERIRSPHVTDIELVWHGTEVRDVYPVQLPDLFDAQPLVVHARAPQAGVGTLEVRGTIAGRLWQRRVSFAVPESDGGNPALATLWARARVADLSRRLREGESPEVANEITELGLRHRLVTQYTSFVAVEESLVVSDGEPRLVRVPVSLPEGVSYEGVFGEREKKGAARAGGFFRSFSLGRPLPGLHDRMGTAPAPAVSEQGPPPASQPASALAVELRSSRRELIPGESLPLEVVVTNRGAAPITLPAELSLTAGTLRVRAIDASWNITILGGAVATTLPRTPRYETVTLAPGTSFTWRLTLEPGLAAFLERPGVYHLYVERVGEAAALSNRLSLRIEPRPRAGVDTPRSG